jgi:UDP-glucose 4-epimerase
MDVSTSSPPLVLVTGATGAVGPRVVEALVEAGWRVRALVRTPPAVGVLPADVDLCYGDITDAGAVAAAMRSCTAVAHLAALLHLVDPPASLRLAYEQVNVQGTANVVVAAQAAGVQRVLLFSTISVYGAERGQVVDEQTPPRPATFYAETKLAAEQCVLTASAADGAPLGVVLRLAAVYGGRVKGNYQRLVQALARGRFLPIGAGENRRTLVYDRDIGQAALLALTHPAARGQLFNVTDGGCHSMQTVVAAICAALGRRPPHFTLPARLVRGVAGLVEDGAMRTGRPPPIRRATIDKLLEDVAVDGRRLQQQLGFRPQFDLAAGWQATVAEMRAGGQL